MSCRMDIGQMYATRVISINRAGFAQGNGNPPTFQIVYN